MDARPSAALFYQAEYMASIVQQMAQIQTNPVLLTLDQQNFETGKKYYLPSLQSEGIQLQVFYHQHDFPEKTAEEHGHFHIFTRVDNHTTWKHWLVISMDRQGQPFLLSSVNQWVTNCEWLSIDSLTKVNALLDQLDPPSLLHSWIVAMLSLYKKEINALLCERDRHLSDIKENSPLDDILIDRDIYCLSALPITLEQQLKQHL